MTGERSDTDARREVLEKTLKNDFYQSVAGSGALKTQPNLFGKIGYAVGTNGYDESMNSAEAGKVRKTMYNDRLAERASLGISAEAPQPGNYEVERKVLGSIDEAMRELPLGDLEAIVKKTNGGELGFEIPGALREQSARSALAGAKVVAGGLALTQEQADVKDYASLLFNAYRHSLAVNAIRKNHLAAAGIVGEAEKINARYETPEEE